jgi:hypothetical protein
MSLLRSTKRILAVARSRPLVGSYRVFVVTGHDREGVSSLDQAERSNVPRELPTPAHAIKSHHWEGDSAHLPSGGRSYCLGDTVGFSVDAALATSPSQA